MASVEIPQPTRYRPSEEALERWLATRKKPRKMGTSVAPGLFSTIGVDTDRTAYWVAVVLEALGVIALIIIGFRAGYKIGIVYTVGAIGLACIDIFVLSRIIHAGRDEICLNRNVLHVTEDPALKNKIEEKINRTRWRAILAIAAMAILALVKALVVPAALGLDEPTIRIVVAAGFAAIVYIHARHTGYHRAAVATQKRFAAELKLLDEGQEAYASRTTPYYFESDIDLFDGLPSAEIVANARHKVERAQIERNAREKKYAYQITSTGLLTDRDVDDFLQGAGLKRDQNNLLSDECIRAQLQQYNARQAV